MKGRLSLPVICAMAAFVFPVRSWGQFQQPTEEELKMTAEPKAPGAAAIYLYREEVDDDNLHHESHYERIKVLTEKGKELATVSVPYPRGEGGVTVTDIKARTIHPDGTVIPLNVKPSDLVEQKSKDFQLNKMVFTLPSVEVGSILEYRWEFRYDDHWFFSPEWDVQQKYFVRKAHYAFQAYKSMYRLENSKGESASKLLYSMMLPEGKKVNYEPATDKYTLDVTDVPTIPDEEYMPPMRSMLQRVQFYYTQYTSKEDFWQHQGVRWSKDMDHFAGESKVLKDAVSSIVAGTDSDDAKARKIYDAVMTLENTDYTRRKSQAELKALHEKRAKDAEDVWTRKSGSSDEIALTYLAMVRIAGLKAHAMVVCDRNREIFNPYFLSMRQLDDVLIGVMINGKETPLDPGTRFALFGELDWRHTQVAGIGQSEKGISFVELPGIPYKGEGVLRTADIKLGRDGSVAGTIRIAMSGAEALRWRRMALENDDEEVKKRFNEYVRGLAPEGVDAEFDHFLGMEDYHLQLMAIVKFSGNMGTATGKRMFLPGFFFESRGKHPFVANEKRETAVDMHTPTYTRDGVTYRLPENVSIESAPTENKIPWEGRAVLQVKSNPQQGVLTVTRAFVRGFAIVPPTDYPALRDFYQKLAASDQQQIVLVAAPASKGN